MCIFDGISYSVFFSRNYAPFELRSLTYYWNSLSSKLLISQNRILFYFIVKVDILCTCAYLQEILIWFFLWENIDLGQKCIFLATWARGNELKWQWCFWQWASKFYRNVTFINQLCVSDYYRYLIMIFYTTSMQAFIIYSIVQQFWSVGYESLLSLSFIVFSPCR